VGPQPLASLARPLGPAARGAGPSAGSGLWTTGITAVCPVLQPQNGTSAVGLGDDCDQPDSAAARVEAEMTQRVGLALKGP